MSIETRQLMNSLTRTNRKQVEQIVLRFATNHKEAGILPNELDQVYRDVIEAVHFRSFFPDNQLPAVKTWEQARQYLHFVMPQFGY